MLFQIYHPAPLHLLFGYSFWEELNEHLKRLFAYKRGLKYLEPTFTGIGVI